MFNIDITTAPGALKGALVNVIVLPFWFISIYLFDYTFFIKADPLLLYSLCIAFTIVSSIIMAYSSRFYNKNEHFLFELYSSIGGAITQVMLHASLIVILYLFDRFRSLDINFLSYLLMHFTFLFGFFLGERYSYLRWKKKTKKNEKN